ncbi:hypothetical protein SOVF_107270 isoform A [Spinacia oleracea]|nr:hypothetical protein SOVF_107270 isoform A [Spinacia oleracea]
MVGGFMAAWSCVQHQGWRKGPWTPEEDKLLIEYVNLHGEGRWSSVSRSAGADCSDTLMDRLVLNEANLTNAVLVRSVLTRSDLTGALIQGADFSDVVLDYPQKLVKLDFTATLITTQQPKKKRQAMIFQIFQLFSQASDLETNLDKSNIYISGVPGVVQTQILTCLGIPVGVFPFRYLGVPQSTKNIYAERLQLVKIILLSLQSYWCPIFVLPNKVIKEVQSYYRVFLWTDEISPSKRALVSSANMYLPRKSPSRSQVPSNAHFQIQVSSNSRFQFSGLNRRLHRGVDRDLSNSQASNCRYFECLHLELGISNFFTLD